MDGYEEEARQQRNWLKWKINFGVGEGEGSGVLGDLQINNTAVKCGKSQPATTISSV